MLVLMTPEEIRARRGQIADMVRACSHFDADHTAPDAIVNMLLTGQLQGWSDGRYVYVVQPFAKDGKRGRCLAYACAPVAAMLAAYREFETIARAEHIDLIVVLGRRAWLRLLPEYHENMGGFVKWLEVP